MTFTIIATLLQTPGTLMIAYAALRVHHRLLHDHKMDEAVFVTMKKEQRIGKLGVLLLVIGFIFELLHQFS